MKTSLSILIVFALLTFSGCNLPSKQDSSVLETDKPEAHEHSEVEPISLNNGDKWVVDSGMITYIREMEKVIHELIILKDKMPMEEYAKTAIILEENVENLTNNCTMTGQSHDELHKWLLPYIEITERFSAARNPEEALAVLPELKTSFELFNKYFQ
ncbi:MAG: hypothetical protein KA444_03580 [Bacteroidia bacterium]|nr:hypothetical protein [Bacteroidia bacterium]